MHTSKYEDLDETIEIINLIPEISSIDVSNFDSVNICVDSKLLNSNEINMMKQFKFKSFEVTQERENKIYLAMCNLMVKLGEHIVELRKNSDDFMNKDLEYVNSEYREILDIILTSFSRENIKKQKSIILLGEEKIDDTFNSEFNRSNLTIRLTEDKYLFNFRIKVHVKVNPVIKAIYNCDIELILDKKYSLVNFKLKELIVKLYHLVNFFKDTNQVDAFPNFVRTDEDPNFLWNNQKNAFIFEKNMKHDLDSFRVYTLKAEYKEIDDLKELLVGICYNPNFKKFVKNLPRSKAFCFEKSIKSHLNFNCYGCYNEEKTPIMRIYYLEEAHKKCRLHLCTNCYNFIISKDVDVRCFVCREFKVNYGKISRIKGGKEKKIVTCNEIILYDC